MTDTQRAAMKDTIKALKTIGRVTPRAIKDQLKAACDGSESDREYSEASCYPLRQVEDRICVIVAQTISKLESALAEPDGWRPIATAPKDGTRILLWCVHPNARAAPPNMWVGPVVGSWSNHNGGGFSWDGHMGDLTHWHHLPAPPAATEGE